MRMTSQDGDYEPVVERNQAWAHLLESGLRRHREPNRGRTLQEISRAYDRIVRHAQTVLVEEISSVDVLATLKVIRILRDKLDDDERILITRARQDKITWQRIADALEMSSRQSAERRHLQLNRAVSRPDGTPVRTQSERVEILRQERGRRAEQAWAMRNGASIRRLATALAALNDLDRRISRARESRVTNRVLLTQRIWNGNGDSAPGAAFPTTWSTALRACLADDARFRAGVDMTSNAPDPEWERNRRESELLHRMFGLIEHAANPHSIDLSDHPNLANALVHLSAQRQKALASRR
jgi:hypothetical protein